MILKATAKTIFAQNRNFAFFQTEDGEDIFVHQKALEKGGFSRREVTLTSVAEMEVKKAEKGLKAIRVLAIDGVTPAKAKQSPPTNAEKTKTPPRTHINQFVNPIHAGENPATAEVLWRITTEDDEFVQYVVTDQEGFQIRPLGPVTSKEARTIIGLETKPKVTRTVTRQEKLKEEALHLIPIAAE